MATRGYIFVACGKTFDVATAYAVWKLRKFSKLPVHVLTNVKKKNRCVRWLHLSNVTFSYRSEIPSVDLTKKANRALKTQLYALSPFDYTLYMDSDVLICSKACERLFRLLDKHDLGLISFTTSLRKNRRWAWWIRHPRRYLGSHGVVLDPSTPIILWHGCVVLFKKSIITKHFFSSWHLGWLKTKKQDMPPLFCALYSHPNLKIVDLGKHGVLSFENGSLRNSAIIKHYSCSIKNYRGLFNQAVGHRVW